MKKHAAVFNCVKLRVENYNKMHQFSAQRAVLKINLLSIKKCAKNNNEVCH